MANADERAGANLRMLREQARLSQGELTGRMKAAGHRWQQSTASRIEAGTQPLRAGELETLAAMFGVSVDRFFWLTEEAMEMGYADTAVARLRGAGDNAAAAILGLHRARFSAEQAAQDARRSSHPRVRDMAGILIHDWHEVTVESVTAAAADQWKKEQAGD